LKLWKHPAASSGGNLTTADDMAAPTFNALDPDPAS